MELLAILENLIATWIERNLNRLIILQYLQATCNRVSVEMHFEQDVTIHLCPILNWIDYVVEHSHLLHSSFNACKDSYYQGHQKPSPLSNNFYLYKAEKNTQCR